MVAVITGDIINSREVDPKDWLSLLKGVLNQYGKAPQQWEIFRGDSFQIKVPQEEAFKVCMHIKAAIRQHPSLDVRLAIGIGDESHTADKISESNGTAYLFSGETFESLKKRTLSIKTPDKDINEVLGIMIMLILPIVDQWSPNQSRLIQVVFENPSLSQKELAKLLHKKSQSSISEGLKRAGYDEIMVLNQYFKKIIGEL